MEERAEEEEESETCAVCGETVDPSDTANFRVASTTIVCGECAHKHGGVYNPEIEEWVVRPKIPTHYQKPSYEV